MRIIQEFNQGPIKCTLMLYNERYTLKLEDQYGEVNYKLGNIKTSELQNIPRLLDTPIIKNAVVQAFRSMRTGRDELVHTLTDEVDDLFEEIL